MDSRTPEQDVGLYILAFFFPPMAVILVDGCGAMVLINIFLMWLGWLPAVCHSIFCVYKGSGRDTVTTGYNYMQDRQDLRLDEPEQPAQVQFAGEQTIPAGPVHYDSEPVSCFRTLMRSHINNRPGNRWK